MNETAAAGVMYINRGGRPLKNPHIPSSLKINLKASVAFEYLEYETVRIETALQI